MATLREKFDPNLVEHIEHKMENTSKSYFDTTLNFIKWNTAISVAATLWFGNYIINSNATLNIYQGISVLFSLIFLLGSILCSIVIFYTISKYFNKHWILYSQWRESYMLCSSPCPTPEEQKQQNEVITGLLDYYKNLPKKAASFDAALCIQMVMLFLGLCGFFAFIVLIKLPTS
jgi:hypothetical protein